ncbi:response regulator [Simplicispira psychrophila]|uniref:response regulator n=1 Tax=Simplicispira psychrophila TaxID=80882 RepID=UPI000569F233|nr:response regulator [Simplicispira psychrophila]
MNSSSPVAEPSWRDRNTLPYRLLIWFMLAAMATVLMALVTYRASDYRTQAVQQMNMSVSAIDLTQLVLLSLRDAETAQRGYLLTNDTRYLEPYMATQAKLQQTFDGLKALEWPPAQKEQLQQLQALSQQKMAEMAQTIGLQRDGKRSEAMEIINTDVGRMTMNAIRALVHEMLAGERSEWERRRQVWEDASSFSTNATWLGALVLLVLILVSAVMNARDYRIKMQQSWIKSGLMGLSARLQGDLRLSDLGQGALDYLARFMDAKVGTAYTANEVLELQRFGRYAVADGDAPTRIAPGQGMTGQVAQSHTLLHVRDVPAGYLAVSSSTGRGAATELAVVPAVLLNQLHAVLEMGFFRKLDATDLEFMLRAAELLASSIRSASDRSKLEELLEETQRQSEELQAQQEELRVSNEELEQQSRILQDSQAQMETQQKELQQSNHFLEKQTRQLERQTTELLMAQDALSEKARDLEAASQYKSEFLANMSHELRTPLNSSLILSKLLADNKTGNLTDKQVKYAQTISAAGNDLLRLINDILDLAKIEAGQATVIAEPVALARTLQALIEPMRPLTEEKNLALHCVVEPGVPENLHTDPQRLGQVLKNLLSNAIKFTSQGDVTLRVSTPASGQVAFAVSDTGIGIPAHQQQLIFDAFRQADGSTHRKYGGTGLGLSISRDLAHLLGGELTVHSTPGAGSTFTLTIPATLVTPKEAPAPASESASHTPLISVQTARAPAAAVALAAALAAPATVPTVGSGVVDDRDTTDPRARTILVVEDDVRFARILHELAQEMGFQCLMAASGSDGLAAALQYLPDAVVLDVNLPDFSGLGVLDQLKRNPLTRHIPVHMVSVADYAQEALGRGAVGYALKPVKREELVEAFQRLEAKFTQVLRRVLVVEDDENQRESMRELLSNGDVQIVGAENAQRALELLRSTTFDCMVMDLSLPDMSGYELLEQMAEQEDVAFPPVIVYTGRSLTHEQEQQLRRFSKSIIIKDARSPERLLDEVTLFLHQVEATLPDDHRRMLQVARDRDASLEGRTVLVVEDDVRNVFALSSVLEPTGIRVEIARNGIEALAALERAQAPQGTPVDLVLMDIMMPEMDGFTAMREIRKKPEWRKLPIIALTAKAMKDDQEKCLAAGANDYIAKPLDVEKLLSLVRVWMPK